MTDKCIYHIFSSLELGGTQRRFLDLVEHSPSGLTHKVLAMDNNYQCLSRLSDSNLVSILSSSEFDTPALDGSLWQNIKTIRHYLKGQKPDLLITYNWGATEWALANRLLPICPVIHIQDGFNPEEQSGEITRRKWLRKIAYGGKTQVIVPSKTLQTIASKSWGVNRSNLHYIPNGIECKRFEGVADAETLRQYGLTDSDMVIGTIAALRPEKNIGALIEAFAKLSDDYPDARLVIVGGGMALDTLKMLTERIGLSHKIIFTGEMKNPECILPRFDIFALSSTTEQMPISVIEAMAAGKPIVSTNVGDIHDMVCMENKPYIHGSTADILSLNIIKFIKNDGLRAVTGANNRKKAFAEYDAENMRERHFELYSQNNWT